MKTKSAVLKQLKITPVIEIACKKAGIGRSTYYKWRKENENFRRQSDIALKNGRHFINDLAESMLIKTIKDGHLTAIIFWLKNHHPEYSEKKIFLSSEDKKELIESLFLGEEFSQKMIDLFNEGKIPQSLISRLMVLNRNIMKDKHEEQENKKTDLINRAMSGGRYDT